MQNQATEIEEKSLAKVSSALISFFFLIFLFLYKTTITYAQSFDITKQFNQTQTINITGNASTTNQAIINSYLNVNADGLTWDNTEADVTPSPSWPLTFTTQQAESISTTPLDSDKFVVAWCDEAGKAINFKIYSTNGQVLIDSVTVDSSPGITNACDYNSVSVSALNNTHFVIAWFDAGEQDASFAVYNSSGNLNVGPIDEDTTVGTNSWGVSVSAFNSTHIVIGYYDYVDQDATFSTWNLITGTRVAGPVDVDTAVAADCYNVHVAALDPNNFAFFYYDAGGTDDATFAVYTITGTAVRAATDEDTAIGDSFSLALTALNSSHFVVAYYDAVDRDITFSIYNTAGTRVTGPIDEDLEVGASGAFVSVAALNSTHFVIGYYDTVDAQHTFSIYRGGTRLAGPIDVSSVASGMRWVAVTSYLAAINRGICNQNWMFAEVYATNDARFIGYNSSGHQWSGYCLPIYQLSVEHNSTISYSGNLKNINVSINFTSTFDDLYNMSIFNFVNLKWDSSPCQNISIIGNQYRTIWCNVTTNPAHYVSFDNKVRIRLNSTTDSDKSTLKEEYVQYYISYTLGYLQVELIKPNTGESNYVVQNYTFSVNATVICKGGPCGNVNGIVMYNLTSPYPNTPINTTYGDKPFFVDETPAYAMKSCLNNPLNDGDFCNLIWVVNASGNLNTNWKIGVYFNSSYPEVQPNNTLNATVSIIGCTEDFTITWNSISFGKLDPNTKNYSAPGNSGNQYNITINPGSCDVDLYIRGTDLVNTTYNYVIKVGNMSWSNISSDIRDGFFPLTYTDTPIKVRAKPNTNVTTWYWLTIPSIYSAYYTGTIYIGGVRSA